MIIEDKLAKSSDWTEKVSHIVVPITAIITLIITILGNLQNLPNWFYYLPVVLLIGWMITFSISRAHQITLGWRKFTTARSRFSKFILLVYKFRDLTGFGQADTVPLALRSVDDHQRHLQNRELAELCNWLTNNLIHRLENGRHNYNQLSLGIHDLHALTHSYHRFYFFEVAQKIRKAESIRFTDEDRKIFEVARENYTRYVEDLQNFCKDINHTLQTKEFEFTFETAKPL